MDHMFPVDFLGDDNQYEPDSERAALVDIQPKGMTVRNPPKPHKLDKDITDDTQLFHTMHMGAAVVDANSWMLIVDGMVERPFSISLEQLKKMPTTSITTFHECYGSPIKPPTTPLWRIGNVRWTGVRLNTLLDIAQPSKGAKFVWSDGLEHGEFFTFTADRYQKDLPIEKARKPEVLLAYQMNGAPLTKERGFPVRLVVPGWFGTNSTKWLCRLSLQDRRAPSPFTTILYNEIDPHDPEGKRMRPVWYAEVNSMICRPSPDEVLTGPEIQVWGRAWGSEEVDYVEVSIDDGATWQPANVQPRQEFEWQRFETELIMPLRGRKYCITARATDRKKISQPLSGRRNHVHSVNVQVE